MTEPASTSDLISLDWEGTHYELELESITAREFKSIKTHTGLKAGQFLQAMMNLADLDADAAVALLWLFRKRAGESSEFDEDLPVFKFLGALSQSDTSSEDDDEADDPKE